MSTVDGYVNLCLISLMTTRAFASALEMAKAAASHAASALSERLKQQESVRVLAATGASQLAFLELLTQDRHVAWDRIELFHLDEYIGLGCQNSASFARYIRQRIIEPTGITRYHLLDGSRKPEDVIAEANRALTGCGKTNCDSYGIKHMGV